MLYLQSFLRKGVSLGRVGRHSNLNDLEDRRCRRARGAEHPAAHYRLARSDAARGQRAASNRRCRRVRGAEHPAKATPPPLLFIANTPTHTAVCRITYPYIHNCRTIAARGAMLRRVKAQRAVDAGSAREAPNLGISSHLGILFLSV